MCIYSMSSAIQAASCYQLQGLPNTCETCPIISTCMPTKKLHFQELKSPKSLTQHGFQECISKCIRTCVKSFQPLHVISSDNPTACTSLTDSEQPKMACQLCLTVRHFISEQYSKLHSMRKCRLSHLWWWMTTSQSILSWTFKNISFSARGNVAGKQSVESAMLWCSHKVFLQKSDLLPMLYLSCIFANAKRSPQGTSDKEPLLRVFRRCTENFREQICTAVPFMNAQCVQ